MNLPDIVAICASSPEQAASFSAAVERWRAAGIYPRELEFVVVHDPPAGRVGSGGGTLHALSQLPPDRSILLIHAGGESRRLPAWAPETAAAIAAGRDILPFYDVPDAAGLTCNHPAFCAGNDLVPSRLVTSSVLR